MNQGQKLRNLRKKYHLTQEEVAKRLDVRPQTIYKYEKGIITNIPLDKLQMLAKLYNTTPAFLTGWELNDRLVYVMYQRGIDIPTLSKMTGIDSESLSEYVKDASKIPKEDVQVLCESLNVSREYLFGENDEDLVSQFDNLPLDYREFCLRLYERTKQRKDIYQLIQKIVPLTRKDISSIDAFIEVMKNR